MECTLEDSITDYQLATPSAPGRPQPVPTISLERRLLLMTPLLSAFLAPAAEASPINLHETLVLQPDQIRFQSWNGVPPHSGEMAKLYGDFNKPGPYLVMMKWHPGYFSAPHNYRTDRIQAVVSGTW